MATQFIDEQERTYFAQARLGDDIRSWLNSDVGKFLHGCAKLELNTVRDELEKISPEMLWMRPFTRRKLKRLQLRAEAARLFMRWCAEAMSEGDFAFRQLETYREGTE